MFIIFQINLNPKNQEEILSDESYKLGTFIR